jgi:hypothetical protein
MALRIQLRRDSASNWTANNPILLSGEIGIETDTLKFKIGNGQRWNAITSYALKLGEANGVATLGPTGKIFTSQMPDTISVNAEVAEAIASITTSNIAEGTNKYYTDARAISAVSSAITDALSTAAADATSKANTAKSEAITAAALDATSKASTAKSEAISAASADAASKVATAKTQAINAAATYTDAEIATEVTARNSAISSAIASEVTARNSAISSAIAEIPSGGNGGSNISTSDDVLEGEVNLYYTADRSNYITDLIASVQGGLGGAIDDLSSSLNNYYTKSASDSRYLTQSNLGNTLDAYVLESGRDSAYGYAGLDGSTLLSASVIPSSIARTSDIAEAISQEVTDRNNAINNSITNLIGQAPDALNTLAELAAALSGDNSIDEAITASLASKAPLASPTFTGTVSGITKAMVGLGNVDNTTDAAKPISTATQTALNLKAPIASPAFTGFVDLTGASSIDFSGASVIGLPSLPDQSNNANKFLTTDGTDASWQTIDLTSYLSQTTADTLYASLDSVQSYGYHSNRSATRGNKIEYGTSATGYNAISAPVAGDLYIQY